MDNPVRNKGIRIQKGQSALDAMRDVTIDEIVVVETPVRKCG